MARTLAQTAQQYMSDYDKKKKDLGYKKYGKTYNPNLDWYNQVGQTQPNWTQLDEDNAKLELQSLENYRINSQTLQNQAQQLYQGASANKAQLGMENQLIQKYLGNNLRALGQNTSGVAESTMAQQGNTYLSNLANINRDTTQSAQDLYNAYSNQQRETDMTLGQRKQGLQETYDSVLMDQMANEIDALSSNNQLSSSVYENIKNKYLGEGLSQNVASQLDRTYLPFLQEREDLIKQNINPDTESFDITTINPLDFGDFVGTGEADSAQTKYLAGVLNELKNNPEKYNGKIFDLNLGNGTDKYIFYNGKIYKTTGNITEKFDNIQRFFDLVNQNEKPKL